MARNITVTLDDGSTHTYNNAPDNITPKDVQSRAEKEFGKGVSHIDGGKSAEPRKESTIASKAISAVGRYMVDKANTGAGALHGAAGIGATIAQPLQAMAGGALGNNAEMRANIPNLLKSYGADPTQGNYQGGKLSTEVGLTWPIGGAVGGGVKALGAERLGNAIASGGMELGANSGSKLANALLRVGGGAINGGLQAGAINPDDAGSGAIAGGALPIAGYALGTAGKAINNMIAPLTDKGKNQIIADFLLNKSGSHTDDVIANLENAKGATAGFNPTVGQASNSADLATLERSFKARNPSLFQDVDQAQRKALADSIRSIGGDDVARSGLVNARTQGTESLYNQAQQKQIQITPELQDLMQRPSMQDAAKQAEQLAAEKGQMFNPESMTGVDAQRIKMGLDDAVNSAPVRGIGGNQLGAIRDTRADYLGQLEKQLPEYLQANKQFAELSKPINQHDLGNAIADKYIPASQRDMPSPIQLNREQLAKVLLDNGDKLASHTTGFKGATLKNTLRPDQLDAITNAVKDGQFMSQGEMLGKGGGSDTTQKLAFNSDMANSGILSKIAPLGATMNALKGFRDVAYSGANKRLEEQLAQALLNPQEAAALMKLRLSGGKNAKLAQQLIEQATAKTVPVLTAQ